MTGCCKVCRYNLCIIAMMDAEKIGERKKKERGNAQKGRPSVIVRTEDISDISEPKMIQKYTHKKFDMFRDSENFI